MKHKIIIITAVILGLLFQYRHLSADGSSNDKEKAVELSPEELTDIVKDHKNSVNYGPFMISRGDTLDGTLIIIDGSLDIQSGGLLDGDAWIINGRLVLTGNARVTGRIKLVNSDYFESRRAEIEGGVYYYKCACRLDSRQFEENKEILFIKKEDPHALKTKYSLKPGYPCRVDYNILRAGFERHNNKHKDPYTSWYARLLVPIWKETGGFLGFNAQIKIPFFSEKLNFVARAFKKTATNDKWQLSRLENGAIVEICGDDFADYYEKRGGEIGVIYDSGNTLTVESVLLFENDISLKARSIPSIFRGDDKFRENPAIDDGKRVSLRIDLNFDNRDESGWKYGGWKLGFLFEKGIADGPGDFSYSAFKMITNRYNEIKGGFKFDVGFKLFSSFDEIPQQLTHSINGYGGIRGVEDYPFTVHRGDRLALLSGELRRDLPKLPFLDILFTRAELLLFSDIGILADSNNKGSPLGFLSKSFEEWRKSAGVGISGKSFLPYIGIYIAEDIESKNFTPRIIVRAQRSF
ncbi:MAG TPA: BamA/TamA family outer membrane protein [Candidatus Krumholzibacteriaceae bacterium]|nr:BamA/TamA family outer membrane protein [Candidatus Krumholzibacteriaceae bacterium]